MQDDVVVVVREGVVHLGKGQVGEFADEFFGGHSLPQDVENHRTDGESGAAYDRTATAATGDSGDVGVRDLGVREGQAITSLVL
jgi:hypothetical protein